MSAETTPETIESYGFGSDKFFLLSNTEADTYFADNEARITSDAEGNTALWWLRTQQYANCAYRIDTFGASDSYFSDSTYGLRPAFWYTWI